MYLQTLTKQFDLIRTIVRLSFYFNYISRHEKNFIAIAMIIFGAT